MLAEKFILALETLIRSRTHPDGSPRVASTSPHVPVRLRSGCHRTRLPRAIAPSTYRLVTPADLLAGMRVSSCSKFA